MTFERFERNFPRDETQIAVQGVADVASLPDIGGALRQFMGKFGEVHIAAVSTGSSTLTWSINGWIECR
jgi:hypothetical protein